MLPTGNKFKVSEIDRCQVFGNQLLLTGMQTGAFLLLKSVILFHLTDTWHKQNDIRDWSIKDEEFDHFLNTSENHINIGIP